MYDNGYVNDLSFFLEGETIDRNTLETFDTATLMAAFAFLVEYASIRQNGIRNGPVSTIVRTQRGKRALCRFA